MDIKNEVQHLIVMATEYRLQDDVDRKITASSDIYNLFVTLDRFFSDKQTNDPSFTEYQVSVPLEFMGQLIFRYKNHQMALDIQYTGEEPENIVPFSANADREQKHLNDLSRMLSHADRRIGTCFPEDFKEELADLKIGDIIHFDVNGKGIMYLCTDKYATGNDYPRLTFTEISQSFNDLSSLQKTQILCDLNSDIDIQKIYRKVKRFATENLHARSLHVDKIEQYIDSLIYDMEYPSSRTIDLGPVSFVVERENRNTVNFFDSDGKKISKTDIALTIGWLRTSPVDINLIKHDFKEDWKKYTAYKHNMDQVDRLLQQNSVDKIYLIIDQLCKTEYQNGLSFTYLHKNNEGKYQKIALQYLSHNDEFECFRITYNQNDVKEKVEKINAIEAFKAMYNEKFVENFKIIMSRFHEATRDRKINKETLMQAQKTAAKMTEQQLFTCKESVDNSSKIQVGDIVPQMRAFLDATAKHLKTNERYMDDPLDKENNHAL